ncbi:hypothetical protein ACFU96_44250 [Streptomyces sp. NPDC057620]|uniref:hypothetical protein n=1 Tax=Streptomyces sp. NPDC057620 TaxID=3346185 RepID=UPI00368A515F
MPQEREYFVIGRWSGPEIDVWKIEEAPRDPAERDDLLEEYRLDAEDAGGSIEIVYADTGAQAEETARREAEETAERISRSLASRARAADRRARQPGTSSRRRVRHHYR